MNKFSVGLGLFDYINPIFYAITSITIIKNMNGLMPKTVFIIYLIGCLISMIFGLSIPTLKFIVGLGIMQFKMPVNLVFYVNTGLFISGLALFNYVFNPGTVLMVIIAAILLSILLLIYFKSKKFNTIAVLMGLFGYAFIYASLIKLAIVNNYYLSVVLYALAICLCLFLVVLGIKSDLKKPKVHWTLEITNVMCQGLVALSTVILFAHI